MTSALTSSIPATSSKVVRRLVSGSYRRARERPKPPSPPPAAAMLRRKSHTSSPMISSVGTKATRRSRPRRAGRLLLGAHLRSALQELLHQMVVGERRTLRLEVLHIRGRLVLRRIADIVSERTRDRVTRGGDLRHVVVEHLLMEERIRDRSPGGCTTAEHQRQDEPIREEREKQPPPRASQDLFPMWGPGHAFALALVVMVGHALHTPRPRSTVVLVAFWRRGRTAQGARDEDSNRSLLPRTNPPCSPFRAVGAEVLPWVKSTGSMALVTFGPSGGSSTPPGCSHGQSGRGQCGVRRVLERG